MGLLRKLKSLLGLEDDRSGVRRTESGVTIEREPDESTEPNADVESAVKGVDAGAGESFATGSGADSTEPEETEPSADDGTEEVAGIEEAEAGETEAAESDAGIEEAEERETEAEETEATAETDAESGISTEDVATAPEAESAESEREEAADPAEAADPSTDAAEPEQTAGDEPESTPEETTGEEPEPDAAVEGSVGEGEPLEEVKGIGPAYAERLRDAGVADVTELAKADAERLAEETGLSDKRISTWIDRAKAR